MVCIPCIYVRKYRKNDETRPISSDELSLKIVIPFFMVTVTDSRNTEYF